MTNDPQRVKKLARGFAAEWVRPSDPDHASPVLLDTLETMMLAFFACASRPKPVSEVADVTRDGLIRRIEADGAVVEFMPDHEGVRIVQPSAAPALDVEPEPLPGEGHEHWRDMAADQVNHFWFTNRESGVLLAEVDRLRGRVNDLVARLRALQETEK